MAYQLTLTCAERKAIDWIGDRYATGDELCWLLFQESVTAPEDADWDDPRDLTFTVPEHIAWTIRDLAEQENNRWPCFAPELAEKMENFVNSIV